MHIIEEQMNTVFIDGKEGTTGLLIAGYLQNREDINLISLPEEERKDPLCRKAAMAESDITVLCLPDAAAIEAVALAEGTKTKLIDASTAHRTAPGWAYGFPELDKSFEDGIKISPRVAVPGCHASGFLAMVYPLIKAELLSGDYPLSCFSLTGYSGGGKKMIAEYQSCAGSEAYASPRQYALTQSHKHLKEMTAIAKLTVPPVFCPVVANYYSGMEVTIPLHAKSLKQPARLEEIAEIYKNHYRGQNLVSVSCIRDKDCQTGDFLAANMLAGKDGMKIFVMGNDTRPVLVAVYDNLRKGAAAAAVECLNLMLGYNKEKGLEY
jgi:N-acetyl-gamma-glutamyl-phosphate reductase